MKRSTPLARTPFKRGPTLMAKRVREQLDSVPTAHTPATILPLRRGSYSGTTSGTPIAKEDASQSQAYQDACKSFGYCMRCGCTPQKGELQFCHRDQGKGKGIKTDVRGGWAGCAHCHWLVGTSGQLPKEHRRAEEDRLALKQRALVFRAGRWPKNLPLWSD